MLLKIKKHWFVIALGVFIVFYFGFLSLVFFAPRIDGLDRGFVGCTKKLIAEISVCQKGSVWCTVKAVLKNNSCDFKVVKNGFILWLKGKQKRPWSNYYFKPDNEIPQMPDEELEAYYREHLDIFGEMEALNKERIKLEKSLNNIDDEAPKAPQQIEEEKKDEN